MYLLQERIEYSKTLKGQFFNLSGYFFSLYCLWKITICTINIIFDRVGKTDPISKFFEISINWLGFDFDVSKGANGECCYDQVLKGEDQ